MSLPQVEISGVDSVMLLDSPCTESRIVFLPPLAFDMGVLLSHRILPSERDLLTNDLQKLQKKTQGPRISQVFRIFQCIKKENGMYNAVDIKATQESMTRASSGSIDEEKDWIFLSL